MWPLLCSGAAAEPPSTAESPPRSDSGAEAGPGKSSPETVTIEAERQRKLIEQQISTFVSSITIPNRDEALARWHSPICPAVTGLSRERGLFVVQRLSQAARDAGVPVAPENCETNFLVLVAPKPGELLRKWWDQHPRMFNDDHGVGGLKHFIDSQQPIRAWYNASLGCIGGAFKVEGGKTFYPSHCGVSLGSKLTWEVVRSLVSVIVAVDLEQVSDLTIGQMTDYVTMIGLAQIRENPNPGTAPTILHLFSQTDTARPDGLSSYDQAFLKSLYSGRSDDATQISQIKFQVYQDVAR